MKRYLILSATALLALAACTKVSTVPVADTQREINFEVANYVQTKADQPNGKYDTAGRFGTYAWYENGSGTAQEFMVNETVAFAGGVWKTVENAYYWPKTGSIDFISYSPFAGVNGKKPSAASNEDAPEPVITRVKVKDYTFEYGSYRVKGDSWDLMYADWANGTANVDEIKDDAQQDSGYQGVPTLFHHALAKINVAIRTTFVEYTDPATKLTTKWEVKLQGAELTNVKNTGSLKLTMDASQKWVKPAGEVWTPDAQAKSETIVLYELPKAEEGSGQTGQEAAVPGMLLTKDYAQLLADYFVLPQAFGTSTDNATAMQLHLRFHIKTTLASGAVIEENYDKAVDLSALTKTADKAWKMNQNFLYKIDIKPTAVEDPNNPDDPTDVEITFDPAVEGWEMVTDQATILL